MDPRGLTTTSYALLGQLALRPWTPYALAAEMRRNLRYFWPRAERGIYAELKRLARARPGDRRGEPDRTSTRTTYAITPAVARRSRPGWPSARAA